MGFRATLNFRKFNVALWLVAFFSWGVEMWSSFRPHYTFVFVTSNVRHHSHPQALRPANANCSLRKLFSQLTISIHFHC